MIKKVVSALRRTDCPTSSRRWLQLRHAKAHGASARIPTQRSGSTASVEPTPAASATSVTTAVTWAVVIGPKRSRGVKVSWAAKAKRLSIIVPTYAKDPSRIRANAECTETTLPCSIGGFEDVTGSVVEMMRHVEAPSAEQLDAATRVIADHLETTPTVTLRLRGRSVLAKLENLQITGSFKIRGALAAIDAAHRDDPYGAVITSSAGNHGLGIAHASGILHVPATVVVPANASAAKVKKLRNYDIELIQFGSSYDEAQAHALELAEARSIRYISPFNDTNVIAGQATIFAEMLTQAPEIEHIVVPVGGGGLIAGVLLARAAQGREDVRVTGVQPEASAAMYHVLHGSAMDSVRHRPTIADGLAGGGDEGAVTNDLIAAYGVPLVLVDEHLIRQGVREAAESNGQVFEGSAATPYAAIVRGMVDDEDSRIGFIASGRNIAHGLLVELLSEPLD